MEFGKFDKKKELIAQINEIKEENVRLQKLCNDYQFFNDHIIRFSEFLKERYTNHLISRISADEFIVIYRYQNDLSNLKREVEYLFKDLRTKKIIDHTDIRVSISIGV